MATAYTLKLNINADASQAIAEARKAQDAFDKLKQNNTSATASTATAGTANTSANAQSVLPTPAFDYSETLKSIASDVRGILRALTKNSENNDGDGLPFARMNKAGTLTRMGKIGVVFSGIAAAIGRTFTIVKSIISVVWTGAQKLFSFIKGAFFNLPLQGLKSLALAIGSLGVAAFAAKKILDPAGQMQSFRSQLQVLVKDPRIAERRLAQLSKYAKDTNYNPQEVIGAGNMLQAYGIYSFRYLKAAGDAANAFGRSISEVVQSLSYLKGGRGGEAMESLSRFGVTRDKLRGYGVKFGRQGQLKTSIPKTMEAVIRVFENEYGGMTERIGQTWNGAIQQLGGEVFDAMANGFKRAVKPATEFITGTVIPLIGDIGKALAAIDWRKYLDPLVKASEGFAGIMGAFLNPNTRNIGRDAFVQLWGGLKSVGSALLKYMGGIFTGAIQSLGRVFANFLSEGGIQNAFKLFGNAFLFAGKIFIASLKTIFDGLPDKIRVAMGLMLDKTGLIDTGVTKERNTMVNAMRSDIARNSHAKRGAYVEVGENLVRYDDSITADQYMAKNYGLSLKELQQIKAAMLASANREIARHGYEQFKFNSLEQLRNIAFRDDGSLVSDIARVGYDHIAYDDPAFSEEENKKWGDRLNWYYLRQINDRKYDPMRHFKGAGETWDKMVTNGGAIIGSLGGMESLQPLTNAIKDTSGIADAWRKNVEPSLNTGRTLGKWRNGFTNNIDMLRSLYGEEAAEAYMQPAREFYKKYPNGHYKRTKGQTYKEWREDWQEVGRKQREVFKQVTGDDLIKAQQASQERQETELKAQNAKLTQLQKTMDKLADLINPIAKAYA